MGRLDNFTLSGVDDVLLFQMWFAKQHSLDSGSFNQVVFYCLVYCLFRYTGDIFAQSKVIHAF